MATTGFRHGRHEANAFGKARRALSTIENIIDCNLAGDHPIWPDRRSGLLWFKRMLFGDDAVLETAEATWMLIGMVAAVREDKSDEVTYDSSRLFLPDLIDDAVDGIDNPVDPFEVIGF